MMQVDWPRFGAAVRSAAVAQAQTWLDVERHLGLSHARVINAAQGKPVGTEIYLTLCHWMQQDPLSFTVLAASKEPKP